MRAFIHSSAVALLAGVVSVGSLGCAMAGADDGGSKAFFSSSDAGSARAAEQQFQAEPTPARAAAPAAAVERRAARPHVAAAHAPRVPHIAVARRDTAHRTLTAEHRLAPHHTMHAMHRAPGADTGHS